MTNPISKAIVKAAVAMGYGKKSDYKGSSVADVLEKFAAIAKDKGGSSSGGEPFVIIGTFKDGSQSEGIVDKTDEEIKAAFYARKFLLFSYPVGTINVKVPLSCIIKQDNREGFGFANYGRYGVISINNGEFHILA